MESSIQANPLPNGFLYLHPPLFPGQLELSCQASSHLSTALSPTTTVIYCLLNCSMRERDICIFFLK